MMYQTGTFKLAFIKEPQMQVLELPYANNKLRMIILLPVGTASVNQVKGRQCQLAANMCAWCVHVCICTNTCVCISMSACVCVCFHSLWPVLSVEPTTDL